MRLLNLLMLSFKRKKLTKELIKAVTAEMEVVKYKYHVGTIVVNNLETMMVVTMTNVKAAIAVKTLKQ